MNSPSYHLEEFEYGNGGKGGYGVEKNDKCVKKGENS
jgi:hypothetical protein